jgi:type I restriction enzyme S subunit
MIADLKPYPEYKASGLAWLGQVPRHWELRPAFGAFKPNRNRNLGMKEKTVLSLSYGRIVIKPEEKLHGLVPESFETYQIVNPGDIVLRTTDLQNDHTSLRVGMVRDRGIITSAYLALRVNSSIISDFGFQFLNVWDTSKAIYGYGSGLRQNLDFSHFKRMPVAVPPPTEQAGIVRFLDWANGRLERAIRAKRKVIVLLNEQKQAIIHRAVTRGLDPSIPLKPSGIPWLGDIPRNFNRTKLGRVCVSIRDGTHNPPPTVSGIHRLLSVRNVINGHFVIRDDDRMMTASAFAELQRSYTVKLGDVVIAIVGATTGKSAVVGEMRNVTVQRSLAILRPNPTLIDSVFLNLLISSNVIQSQIKQIMDKYAAQPGIYLNELSGLQVIYPSINEQRLVIKLVEDETAPLNTTVSRLEREIDLLREYRICLVADVVTGKLDVREAATRLSYQTTPDIAEEDIDLSDETKDVDEEIVL